MKSVSAFFISMLFLFLLSGCAGGSKVETWQLSDGRPDKALFVVDVNFTANRLMESHHECKIQARFHDGSNIDFKIRPGKRRYFWAAPEGRYEMKAISCGLFTSYDFSEFPDFTVKNKESYYFGQINIELEDKDNLRWSLASLDREQLLSQYLSLPNSIKPYLFSPFSRKKITEPLIRNSVFEPKGEFRDNPKLAEQLRDDWPFSSCQKNEKERNPLKAGQYMIDVEKEAGQVFYTESLRVEHLYTEEFTTCVMSRLEEWMRGIQDNQLKLRIIF